FNSASALGIEHLSLSLPLCACRTATVWKNLNPFWGEEYTLHLPLGFHSLTFYVLDEDTIGTLGCGGPEGTDPTFSTLVGIDSWINLTRVDPNEEVQGEIRLELWVLEEPHRRVLHCHVIEARDLAPRDISGTSDPFARVSCNGQTLETAIIKKTRFPHWDEVLEFDLEERELEKETRGPLLSMEVWDWDMVGKNDFLGQVEFSLDTLQKSPVKGWFRLLPFPSAEEDAGGKLGALRLKVQLAEDRILPSMYYQPLIELLEHVTPLAILEEIGSVESRQDVAMKLVKIFLGQGLAVPFLDYLNLLPSFFSSLPGLPCPCFPLISLSSLDPSCSPQVVGMPYLNEVLKPIINRIFEEKKYVELDPCKIEMNRTRRISFKGSLSEAQIRESSLELLKGYLSDIMESIIGSVEKCPPIMRVAFKQLHKRVEDQFPEAEHEDMKYIAISGFLFLRFFAPAILTPKLFNLRDQHADPRTSRTLLLLAKAVQSIGNLGLQLGHGKEQWMAPLHPFIIPCVSHVKDFLDKLIDVDSEKGESSCLNRDPSSHLPCSPQGTISWWGLGGGLILQVRSSIPIQRICAVERVDENAFQQPHMMQIITQDAEGQLHTMYIQCKNVNELNQWLSAIRKASIYNERMLPSCHPGAFRGSRWTCCLQADRTVHGCSRTHSAVTLGDWSDPLDPDAEAQMVYGQLLLVLRAGCIISLSPADHERSFQDCRMAATARLLDVIQDLERAHSAFERREKEEAATESY
uniref:RAS protein activator like 1 n=1 Tax=Crocodylus porosus TaxID=8502 RepID=A0A7M4EHS9_CROPO